MPARLLLVVLAFPLALSGCSWITRFAVTNGSDAPVKLTISAEASQTGGTQGNHCPLGKRAALEVTTTQLNRWGEIAWRKLPEERYMLDLQHCVVEIEIFPEESVSVAGELTYVGHRREFGTPGGISSLSIKSKDGEISSKGWEITKRFERLSDTLYVYAFR